MAKPKKGQLAQFECVLVDSTDFASVESGITESDFNSGATRRWYGYNQGTSTTFTSGALSKTGRLIRSGVFLLTVNATENAYDRMHLRINKTGCAEQIIPWENLDYDDSDIMSRLSDIGSDLRSYLVAMSDVLSNAYSAAAQGTSQVLLVKSSVSDVYSLLSDLHSDVGVVSGVLSDAMSALTALSDAVSDVNSNLGSRLDAQYASTIAYLASMSNALSDAHSDLASKIGGITATVSASDISDIASAVWAAKYTANSNASSFGSLMKDNIYSLLSDLQSDFQSRVPKEVASKSLLSDVNSDLASKIGAITVTISASDVSDIASAVVAGLPIAATVDNIYSMLSDFESNFNSRIPKEPASKSLLSDVNSNLLSYLVGISDIASNAYSAAAQGSSRTLLNQSRISDIQSFLSDFDSNFQSRVPKEVAARSQLSDLSSDLRSYLAGVSNTLSDVYSLLSDLHSDIGVVSGIQSDMYSLLTAGVEVGASSMSDIRSAITANGVLVAGADPTGVIGVTDSIKAKIDWLTAMSRNELTQTATSAVLKNDAGTAIASATLSDDTTTFTRGEWH